MRVSRRFRGKKELPAHCVFDTLMKKAELWRKILFAE